MWLQHASWPDATNVWSDRGLSGRLCLTGLGTEKYAVMVGRISFVILCKMVLAEAMGIYDRIEWSVRAPKWPRLG
jgi:hypothetical protein